MQLFSPQLCQVEPFSVGGQRIKLISPSGKKNIAIRRELKDKRHLFFLTFVGHVCLLSHFLILVTGDPQRYVTVADLGQVPGCQT